MGYVVGRIEWYSRFTDQLLSQSSFRNESPLAKVRTDIEISITNLYQSLLFYQIKSVCCFYQRHQILVLVRGALRFDNWKGDLDDIKAAEKALRESCDFYSLECLKGQIREISMKHDIQEKVVMSLFRNVFKLYDMSTQKASRERPTSERKCQLPSL